jgi:glyoxylase-like metal-dependent hydrolase (beta-lactamase superfamily II)
VGAESPSFAVETLGPGVHVFRPTSERPVWVNSLVVERDDGLLVVAAQPTPEAARQLLASIETRIGKPVRYLVLPNPHADAAGGASAFPASVLVIGSLPCRDAIADPEYDFGAEARSRADDPAAWVAPPRRAPTLVISAVTDLDDSRNPVRLLPMGHLHSIGDMMVVLPGLDLFFVGPVAFPDRAVYADDSRINSWNAALSHLVREGPRLSIPLRGETVSVGELREERNALAWLIATIASALSEKLTPEQVHERILADVGTRFDSESPLMTPFIEEAIRQIQAVRARK